jgi:hypothetical protein
MLLGSVPLNNPLVRPASLLALLSAGLLASYNAPEDLRELSPSCGVPSPRGMTINTILNRSAIFSKPKSSQCGEGAFLQTQKNPGG